MFCRVQAKSGRRRAKCIQRWPKSSPHRPKAVQAGRCRANCLESGPNLAEIGRLRSNFGRYRSHIGKFRPKLPNNVANLAGFRPNLIGVGRIWLEIRARSTGFGPVWANFGLHSENLRCARALTNAGQWCALNIAIHAPRLAFQSTQKAATTGLRGMPHPHASWRSLRRAHAAKARRQDAAPLKRRPDTLPKTCDASL